METFKDVISGNQLVLVDFFATWCQPCKMMHPILEQVKAALGEEIDQYQLVARYDVLECFHCTLLFYVIRDSSCFLC